MGNSSSLPSGVPYLTVADGPLELDVPPLQAFEFLADMENEALWHPRVKSGRKTSDGPIGLGTEFAFEGLEGTLALRHDEFVRGQRLGNTIVLPDGTIERWSATFLPSRGGGTILLQAFQLPLSRGMDAAEITRLRTDTARRLADLNPHLKRGVEGQATEPTLSKVATQRAEKPGPAGGPVAS
jgi:hypothetical protein